MISVCCCAINSKYDVECFVRALHQHNPGVDFEICLTLDDRVDDGSPEYLSELQKEFSNLFILRRTHEDAVEYLTKCLDYYDHNNKFSLAIRSGMRANLERFAVKELFDHKRSFMWLSSGHLYNMAVSMAKGDTLIVTPGDFLYMFGLQGVQEYVNKTSVDGMYYSSPHAVWSRISNLDAEWLRQHVDDVHNARVNVSDYRWDSIEPFRDFFRCPCLLSDYYLPDFYRNELVSMTDQDCLSKMERFVNDSFNTGGVKTMTSYHGYHIMTRKTFDKIGGFSEEFYGRAWADDRMSKMGAIHSPLTANSAPLSWGVAWVGQAEILHRGPGYPPDYLDQLKAKYPYYDRHPLRTSPVHLHDGVISVHDLMPMLNPQFGVSSPVVRII